jgi:C1A family cysteine protease
MRVGYVSILSFSVLALLGACTTSSPSDDANASAELSSPDGELTLEKVQAAIGTNKASWTAGETSVSRLSRTDRTARLGVPASESPEEETIFVKDDPTESITNDAPPAAFDWRNVEGKNYVSPIQDQGRCGSCVAFATVGTFESQLNIAASDPSSPWQLSPQYLFACGGGGCGSGWFPSSAARYLVSKGVPDNACMPYVSGAHGDDARCNAACSDAASRSIKARASTTPTSGGASVAAVKRALQNGPLVASMTVYDDFMFYTGGVYKHATGNRAGGHAVSIVGWNDEHQSWVVRNSWGTRWGMQGYFEIAWNDVSGVGSSTIGFDVPAPGPYVALAGIRDGMILSGRHPLAFDTQSFAPSSVSWTLTSGATTIAQGKAPSGSATTLDTTTVPDGVYVLQPHAMSGSTRVDGPRHLVYVLNGKETGNIRFTTLTAGQTLHGTALFDVAVAAQPVPVTHVEWTIVNEAGTTIVNRTAGNPGALMELGWNTTKWPNGNYTINITGGAGTQMLQPASVAVTVRN